MPPKPAKGRDGTAAPAAEVVEVHRAVQHEVAVGIEALWELAAVMVEVGLHLEPPPDTETIHPI